MRLKKYYCQGRSQEFATGDKRGDLGDGSPPAGSRGRAPVAVWGEALSSQRQMLISSYDGGTCTHVPLAMPLIYCNSSDKSKAFDHGEFKKIVHK